MTPDAPDPAGSTPQNLPARTTDRPPVTQETPGQAAARYPEIAQRFEEHGATDSTEDRRLLWRETAVIVLVTVLLVVRALWFV
ncbi:hypothetical protein ACWFRJ_31660 [Streptomyces sp. NPDC055239]